jgi:hypothetical protein
MDEPNSSIEQPGLIARLGNWLKKDVPTETSVHDSSTLNVRYRGPSTRVDMDAVERQIRKARLGEIRKTEFDELRRSIGHTPIPKGSTFSLTSALIPNTSFLARARQNTRLKIDSIEEQISRSWFNSGLHRGSAISGMATQQGSVLRPYKSSNQTEMKVEVNGAVVTLTLPPEALNAATAYALGDFVSAEQVLIALTKKPEPLEAAQISWDLLFEFYLVLGRQAEFENLSVDFAGRFGKSPPLWTDHWDADLTKGWGLDSQSLVSPRKVSTLGAGDMDAFVVASSLVADDVDALAAHFDQSTSSGRWEVDWRKLNEVGLDALPRLLSLTEKVMSGSGEVRYQGASVLTDVLWRQAKLPGLPLEIQKQLWHFLAAHLQLVGDRPQLEEVSFQYSVLFEEVLSATAAVTCHYVAPEPPAPVDGLGSDAGATRAYSDPVGAAQATRAPPPSLENGFKVVDLEMRLVAVTGTLKGDISKELAVLPLPSDTLTLVFECKGFARLDSQAAGHLLSFLRGQQCGAGAVKFRDLNRLIGVYLFSFGLPQNVTLSLVTL